MVYRRNIWLPIAVVDVVLFIVAAIVAKGRITR